MRGLVLFLIVLVIITSFSFVSASLNSNNERSKIKAEESKNFEFSTFTSAVCENREELVHCKDEVFVNCDGKISKAIDVAECNEIKFDVPKATGFAVFEKEWRDPRG